MVVDPGASPPDPHAFGGTGFFQMLRHHSHFGTPQKTCHVTTRGTRVTQTLPKNKAMRFHPQSPFGKAWAAHFKAANLARLSDEEKRVEYNRFSTEWEENMGRGSALGPVHSA
jgi:hypothetical protein